jgi:Spy/CpxP family protein refolding chaperone
MHTKCCLPKIVAAVALLAIGTAVPVYSAMRDMSMMPPGGGHMPMMGMENMDKMDEMMGMCLQNADKIGLTEEQIAKIKPLHNEMRKKQARYKADQKIAEIEMTEIMDVKDFDLEKANAAVRKIADLKTAHQMEMLKSMKEVRAGLTDEQFGKMKKMMMSMQMGGKKQAKRPMKK